jgi:catechol 2,3-dioxygenase-like lactoylglutathione lyase family enzyme
MINQLHHMAFRCRDSEETRAFYEDVIGLPLAAALELKTSATGRPVEALHSFFEIRDGSFLAFFEVPGQPFEFKPQHDFDLHIALQADLAAVQAAVTAAKVRGLEIRGPSDHDFIRSTYFRDPNGYVVELAVPVPQGGEVLAAARGMARAQLEAWTARRRNTVAV